MSKGPRTHFWVSHGRSFPLPLHGGISGSRCTSPWSRPRDQATDSHHCFCMSCSKSLDHFENLLMGREAQEPEGGACSQNNSKWMLTARGHPRSAADMTTTHARPAPSITALVPPKSHPTTNDTFHMGSGNLDFRDV